MTPILHQIRYDGFKFFQLVLGLILTFYWNSNGLQASEYHSNEEIRNTAVDFVRAQIPEEITIKEITAGEIDPRIHFKQCSQALEASSTSNQQIAKNWTVGVRCADIPSWSIYIPVKARLSQKMIVSKTTITRGEMISVQNIELVDREISNSNQNYFSDISNVTGREARRTIRPNRVIKSTMLQQALMVHKKETVLIYAKNNNLQISMKGTALNNGRYNQMIKVRNNSSKKIIEAVVIDRGVVAINF